MLVLALMWQLETTVPTPYAYMHLHGPHTHGVGIYPTEAECVKNGKEIVKSNAHIKGFKPNSAAYRCYSVESD